MNFLCFIYKTKNFARLMGADPTASHVTGGCSTVELQPQNLFLSRFNLDVPESGIEPLSKAYESFVLPLNYTGVL